MKSKSFVNRVREEIADWGNVATAAVSETRCLHVLGEGELTDIT